jgi:hypothetical protein
MPFYTIVRSQDNILFKEFRLTTPEIVKKKFRGQILWPTFKITSMTLDGLVHVYYIRLQPLFT